MIDKALISRLLKKEHLALTNDYVPLRDALRRESWAAAEILRDDIWLYNENDITKQGKWKGAGLGKIPAKDIVERALELERMAKEGVELHPIKWTFEEREEREKEQLTDRKSIQKVHGKYRKKLT